MMHKIIGNKAQKVLIVNLNVSLERTATLLAPGRQRTASLPLVVLSPFV